MNTSEDIITADAAGCLDGLLIERSHRSPHAIAYRQFDKPSGQWIDMTWTQVLAAGNESVMDGIHVASNSQLPIPTLEEAIEILAAAGRDFFVYLVGEGADRPKYEAEIKRRGLFRHMFLVGNRPHCEIPIWMGAADVFCLPSIREGFPNVVLESLFCGRPVVATRVGGVPEMVNMNNGILVEPKDPEELAGALDEALKRKWDHKSILSTVSHLSWESASKQYLLSLDSAIKKQKRG